MRQYQNMVPSSPSVTTPTIRRATNTNDFGASNRDPKRQRATPSPQPTRPSISRANSAASLSSVSSTRAAEPRRRTHRQRYGKLSASQSSSTSNPEWDDAAPVLHVQTSPPCRGHRAYDLHDSPPRGRGASVPLVRTPSFPFPIPPHFPKRDKHRLTPDPTAKQAVSCVPRQDAVHASPGERDQPRGHDSHARKQLSPFSGHATIHRDAATDTWRNVSPQHASTINGHLRPGVYRHDAHAQQQLPPRPGLAIPCQVPAGQGRARVANLPFASSPAGLGGD